MGIGVLLGIRLRQRGFSAISLAIALVASLTNVQTTRVSGQAPVQLPTRFGIQDRKPDFTIFEDFARNSGAFRTAAVGDFNGDGIGDLLITNSRAGPLLARTGRAYLVFGKRAFGSSASINLASEQPDVTILGPQDLSNLGFGVATGDLNGDGIDDIILSAVPVSVAGRRTGAIYVIFGSGTFNTRVIDLAHTSADLSVVGAKTLDVLGPLAVGDINADGAKDLVFRQQSDGPEMVSVLLGPFTAGTTFDLAVTPPDIVVMTGGGAVGGRFVATMALADVNGDQITDLIMGSPDAGRVGSGFAAGEVDILMGSSAFRKGMTIFLSQSGSAVTILGAFGGGDFGFGDRLGSAIAIGDVNADGINDIVIGVPTSTRLGNGVGATSAGETYVVFGSPILSGRVVDTRQNQQDLIIQGTAATVVPNTADFGDSLGTSIAAGDIDGDGVADLLIGAPGAGGTKDFGAAYVVLGSPELTSGTIIKTSQEDEDIAVAGKEKFAYLGSVVATGDLNGDGFSDLILEAPFARGPNADQGLSGAIYVYFGAKVRPPEITKAKFKEGKSQLLITGTEFTGDLRVEINGMIINREVTFLPLEGRLVVRGTRRELNLGLDSNQVVVLRKGTRSNVARIKG